MDILKQLETKIWTLALKVAGGVIGQQGLCTYLCLCVWYKGMY